MEVNINEIASLVQQIESLMDDSERGVISADVGRNGNSSVLMNRIAFFTEFPKFNISNRESGRFPYELSASVGGVDFHTHVNDSMIDELQTDMPDVWVYIQIQLGEGCEKCREIKKARQSTI